MAIQYKKGCAIQTFLNYDKPCAFAHGVNCQNTMGSGVAKLVKTQLPTLYREDQKTLKGCSSKLGHTTFVIIEPYYKIAFNLYTQLFYGRSQKRYIDYPAICSSLKEMRGELCVNNFYHPTIIMPKIGSGLGGGDWNTISNIIDCIFEDYHVIICEL